MQGTNASELSLAQARNLHLAAQGLLAAPTRTATRADVLRCIARMQLLQIDSIHVVARSPYLVLFSRLGHYPPVWLDEALERGSLFEAWAHEACFVPSAQLALHRSYNRARRKHWGISAARDGDARQRDHVARLLEHVRLHGAVRSSDFARGDARAGGWWEWKDEKLWLEALFANGDLMVARRQQFQRVYDLTERVQPSLAGMELPDAATVHDDFVERAVTALGVTQARWINDYFRTKPRLRDADLGSLVARGRLLPVRVKGWDAQAYVHATHKGLLARAFRGALCASHSSLLSPFDPLVWDRERAAVMFDFDYRIECYTPAHKRVHGYFVLPLLHCGELVGRLDAKAHRANASFEVKNLYLQAGVVPDAALATALAGAIQRCAHWHGTPRVEITQTTPRRLRAELRRALRRPIGDC